MEGGSVIPPLVEFEVPVKLHLANASEQWQDQEASIVQGFFEQIP